MNEIVVAADLRWPLGTGIGICQNEYCGRAPRDFRVQALPLKSGVGSPVSPFEIGMRLSRRQGKNAVFWSPGFMPPAWSAMASAVTVHDLTHLHFYSAHHRHFYNVVLRPMYRRCNAILCVSEYTRSEFLEWSGIEPVRAHVVYNGVSPRFHPGVHAYSPGYPYVFYPGNKRSYKNLDRLLRAYARSSLPGLAVKIVMTGVSTPELDATMRSLGMEGNVVFLGFVAEDELPGIYRGAVFTAFVSLYEGFGLPIVESMAVGTPVLTSNVSSMPEIGSSAARLVSPYDLDDMAHAMDELIASETLRSALIAKGLVRAKDFSWDNAALATWDVIRSTVSGR